MWIHKNLRDDLKTKKDTYRKWKEGQATKEEYSQVAQKCRNGVRDAKAENELRLARDAKSNKKAFFRYVNSKRQRKEMVVQLLNEDGKFMDPQLAAESDPKSAYQWYLLKLGCGNKWGTAGLSPAPSFLQQFY